MRPFETLLLEPRNFSVRTQIEHSAFFFAHRILSPGISHKDSNFYCSGKSPKLFILPKSRDGLCFFHSPFSRAKGFSSSRLGILLLNDSFFGLTQFRIYFRTNLSESIRYMCQSQIAFSAILRILMFENMLDIMLLNFRCTWAVSFEDLY